jgi:hypothetical protein
MRCRCLFAVTAITPILIAAAEPVRLQPSSAWVLDYGEDSCRLIRTFGEGKEKTTLVFESDAPNHMDMLATGKPLANYNVGAGARFLPAGGKTFVGQSALSTSSGDPAILWSNVYLVPNPLIENRVPEYVDHNLKPALRPPPISLAEQASYKARRQEFAEKSAELEIQTRWKHAFVLETGSMGKAISMFDKCSRDSLRDWGVDPNLEDKIVRPAWTSDASKWFTSDDYPKVMLTSGEVSEVRIRLLVDASGKVTKCTSLCHFKNPEFNEATCNAIMKRATLEPAELADGTKVPSYFTQRVVFRIEYRH